MQTPSPIERSSYSTLDKITVTLLLASLSLCIGTRILTGLIAAFSRNPNEPKLLPYWIPRIGHAFPLALKNGWLDEVMMKNHEQPAFKLILFGRTFVVVNSPALIESLSSQKESLSFKEPSDHLSRNLFGSSKLVNANAPCSAGIYAGQSWMSSLNPDQARSFCLSVVNRVQRAMPDLVSFLESPVDQQPWEKGCDEEPELGSRTALIDLYTLVRDFVGFNLTAELMGSCFMNAYQVVLTDIFLFNKKFDPISLGIPRYLPVPGIVPPYTARKRLLEGLTIFHKAFRKIENGGDPGIDWRDLDDVSDIMRARAAAWMKAGVDEETAASGDLPILWAMNTEVTSTVFWQIVYILSNDDLFDRAMEEIKPFAKAFRPESQFKMLEPTQLTLDVEGLAKCRFLKASLYETVRLTSTELIVGKTTQQLDLRNTGGAEKSQTQQQPIMMRVQEGEYVAALANSCELYGTIQDIQSSDSFDAGRFRTAIDGNEPLGSEFKNGPLFETDTTKELEEKIILSFVAAFLATWDIEPIKGQPLVPKSTYAPLVKIPKHDVRVCIEPAI
ncbi:hypothetical protein KEM54_001818 [Ascosphaera aggregata]|nr:hypothetical protein KEM54_001818 [Ascosphaera aggregata]